MDTNQDVDFRRTQTEGTAWPRTIAVISGKGGSGKTMIAAVMAEILDLFGPVALIDADTGTGGLSYYLGLKLVPNVAVGLADLALNPSPHSDVRPEVESLFQPLREFKSTVFLGVGNHRRLTEEVDPARIPEVIGGIVEQLRRARQNCVIVDCRGGIDAESIAICRAVDDIILIVEPDITSFQATQHVVDILSGTGLGRKLRGFVINKVFEDPSSVVRNGTAVFRCQCLGAVPFDLDATRDFLVGDIPSFRSQFGIQVWAALRRAYLDVLPSPPGRVWTYPEFSQVSLTNIDSVRGGLFCGAMIILLGLIYLLERQMGVGTLSRFDSPLIQAIFTSVLAGLGIIGSIEPLRRSVGRAISAYVRLFFRPSRGRQKR
jgi:flagellar biosynthesis protein FlhG